MQHGNPDTDLHGSISQTLHVLSDWHRALPNSLLDLICVVRTNHESVSILVDEAVVDWIEPCLHQIRSTLVEQGHVVAPDRVCQQGAIKRARDRLQSSMHLVFHTATVGKAISRGLEPVLGTALNLKVNEVRACIYSDQAELQFLRGDTVIENDCSFSVAQLQLLMGWMLNQCEYNRHQPRAFKYNAGHYAFKYPIDFRSRKITWSFEWVPQGLIHRIPIWVNR